MDLTLAIDFSTNPIADPGIGLHGHDTPAHGPDDPIGRAGTRVCAILALVGECALRKR